MRQEVALRLVRLVDQDRPEISFTFEDRAMTARQGDTLLTAILAGDGAFLRESEFGDGHRAGFCLMGACQDCRVVLEGSGRVRACTTLLQPGMRVRRA
ncbi:(2Fe-2S)-binding protein [Roseomonas frigidaquae]|uniref:(2Fe-2S)-binding protein n=1 Tax=Falsiroseomonas frigidaquae TaxID=487318 RepID=A0ABX1ET58_9PROT|nr:(2Fe-2S)-binding protein [Falsiroseomonas frigidaquae]NKE43814.1 (2Fe-2S)-binding protein [Falsiroseomonas frigidaquae]